MRCHLWQSQDFLFYGHRGLSRIFSHYLTLTIIVTENACWSVETIIFHSEAVITE